MPDTGISLPLTVDGFTLDRRIGAGAMGEVFHAREAISGREVAIKILAGHLVGNRRAEARFRREIAAMGQLRHDGIPAFAGWGELPGGRPYLAMEYIPGHPLDAFVAPGRPLREELALWVALRLSEVIGHCHRESGMIHRDLKPGNIMVDLAGEPGLCQRSRLKIIDFGLATYIDFGDFEDFSDIARGYASGGTLAGEIMGTPAYMSPEQIRGEQLGFQSDIYAIGAILYHLLTGRLPYEGPSAGVVMARHLDAPVPDPARLVPVRPATAGVVQRAMAKTPHARFRSYQQFSAALQAAGYASDQATRRVPRTGQQLPGEAQEQPTTRGTEEAFQARGQAPPPRPAVPTPPGSSGAPAWKRPVVDPPTTSAWRRPVATPPPAAAPSPPAAAGESDLQPTPAPPVAEAPVHQPPTTSRWRRPIRTPPPPDASAGGAGTEAAAP